VEPRSLHFLTSVRMMSVFGATDHILRSKAKTVSLAFRSLVEFLLNVLNKVFLPGIRFSENRESGK
jgi:hypothetical protein